MDESGHVATDFGRYTVHINPGLCVIRRSAHCVQFGMGAEGVVVDGLQADELTFIERLRADGASSPSPDPPGQPASSQQPTEPGQHADFRPPDGATDPWWAALALECGLPPVRARRLIAALRPVLVAEPPSDAVLTGLRSERLHSDRLQWSAAYGCDAVAVLSSRARAAIRVVGLGRTGAAIAQSLAGSGIGTLLLDDPRPVRGGDVGAGGHRISDIGLGRAVSVRRQIHRLDPTTNVHLVRTGRHGEPATSDRLAVDLAVLVGYGIENSTAAASLMVRDQPHLVVVLRETDSLIGPLVVPGTGTCLECVRLHRADADPHWAQAYDGTPDGIDGEEGSLALSTAGIAAMQTLLYVDAVNQPDSFSGVVRVHAADGSVHHQDLEPHPRCGCQLQRRAG